MHKERRIVLYPFLFAIYPVVSIYAHNIGRTSFREVVRPIVAALILTAVLLAIALAIFKNRAKAGVFVSLFVGTFFPFGYGPRVCQRVFAWSERVALITCLIAWIALLLIAFIALLRARRDLSKLTQFLVVLSLILLVFPVVKMCWPQGSYLLVGVKADGWARVIAAERRAARKYVRNKARARDIYYIVLDTYARQDVLMRGFGYDNSPFIKDLEERGFYVAKRSRANYLSTGWSLPSSLNYDYLDRLARAAELRPEQIWKQQVGINKITWVLKDKGYKYVSLDSGWGVTHSSPCADIVMSRSSSHVSELEWTLIDHSALYLVTGWRNRYLRQRTLAQFADLARIAKMPETTFTFAHMVCPHQPYVFDSSGDMPTKSSSSVGAGQLSQRRRGLYIGQLRYVNKLTIKTIDAVLANSEVVPIIVLQADHGTWLRESDAKRLTESSEVSADEALQLRYRDRVPILNAYYFPNDGSSALYPTISPVNSFRVMLNEYFGANYKLLPDVSYIPQDTRGRKSLRSLTKYRGPD